MSSEMLQEFCDEGTIKGYNLDYILDEVKSIDYMMRNSTAKYMCT